MCPLSTVGELTRPLHMQADTLIQYVFDDIDFNICSDTGRAGLDDTSRNGLRNDPSKKSNSSIAASKA